MLSFTSALSFALFFCVVTYAPFNNALAAGPKSKAEFVMDLVPDKASDALRKIPELGRKLLAARSYLRVGTKPDTRWSWTEEQIADFQGSAEQKAILADVAAINAHFSRTNPGYSLYINTKVRSLDVQIKRWNSNESVGVASEEILTAWRIRFGKGNAAVADLDIKTARNWLKRFRSKARARLAAPGLTRHGKASAIDFQIKQAGKIIARADSISIKTIWHAQGWDAKLKQNVEAAGPSFRSPLLTPYEPWHYEYEPTSKPAE